ncbi:unnamed protein product [Spirodela intermedia]|uniref:Uncharacterized protein n=1 Tax=Spirodela intermedia TaxID=51605 RepID=A0A7I8KJE4_SPIIN|nr:unnamed protein product [Spirodela intermedia]
MAVRLETKELIQEADELTKRNAQLRCQILEKQKKISSLEIESATLSQTLELLHKEFDTLQEKVKEERIYYEKVAKEMNSNLQGQQDWINSHKLEKTSSAISVKDIGEKLLDHSGGSLSSELPSAEEMTRAKQGLELIQVDSASAKLDELKAKTSEVSLNTVELKQRIAQFQLKTEGFPCEIKTAETKILEEEHQALLTDKGGELEYLQSLQERIGLFLSSDLDLSSRLSSGAKPDVGLEEDEWVWAGLAKAQIWPVPPSSVTSSPIAICNGSFKIRILIVSSND